VQNSKKSLKPKTHLKHTFCRVADYFQGGIAVLDTVIGISVLAAVIVLLPREHAFA
jgi:hypothetical protein